MIFLIDPNSVHPPICKKCSLFCSKEIGLYGIDPT